jgi:c-di-GMP phosphodiesterase
MGIEIQDHWLSDRALSGRIKNAQACGTRLVWHGVPGQAPSADVQGWFHNVLRSLSPQEALRALRAAKGHLGTPAPGKLAAPRSPVVADSLYEGLASPALVAHALDAQGAAGVVGWPTDEVLHTYHLKHIQPARHLLMALVQAIDSDESMESIEHHMGNDPLLAYRFMRYANSAGLGLQRTIENVREGLMAIGYTQLRAWATQQMPHTSCDPNLDPIRASIVLRARIMEQLANAGVADALRREVFMCGLFSQLDLLLDEPLDAIVLRLPLSGRVTSALLRNAGPYAAWLEVAAALEGDSTRAIREVCDTHGVDTEEVNRALLHALAAG